MDSSTQRGRVRVVARIKGFGDQNLTTAPSISIRTVQSKSSGADRVLISFSGEESSTSNKPFSYEVDHCYDHEASNLAIFDEEIKPLVSSVFEGKSATVFAYGARGSGKTYTIQGSENVPGFMTLSMSDFFSRANEVGNCISVSLYEVVQERVFDLLSCKKPEISVLEGPHGKVVLKGLSKVIVKSMSDFHKSCSAILQRQLQKMPSEPPQRSHRGMIINVSSSLEDASLLGRMNLVDLAGYEDKRQSVNGSNLIDISRINKCLYAVHNVFHALKSNETHVPYRESKLTRMLQGSLGGGMNKILMITCVDPSFSEDTVKALSLASRPCNVGNKTKLDSTSRDGNLIKPTMTPTSSFKQAATLSSKTVKPTMEATSSFKQAATPSSKTVKPTMKRTGSFKQTEPPSSKTVKPTTTPSSSLKQTGPLSSKMVKPTMTPKSSYKQTAPLSSTTMKVARSYVLSSTKKQDKSVHKTEKKSQGVKVQGRNLFEVQQSATKKEGEKCVGNAEDSSQIVSNNEEEYLVVKANKSSSAAVATDEASVHTPSIQQPFVNITEPSSPALSTDENSSLVEKTDVNTPHIKSFSKDIFVSEAPVDHQNLVTPDIDNILQADKENKGSILKDNASPPLSVRLLELKNSLKSLYTSTTPLKTNMELENYELVKGNDLMDVENWKLVMGNDQSGNDLMEVENCKLVKVNEQLGNDLMEVENANGQFGNELTEPSTPVSQPILTSTKKCQYSSIMSPWERLQIGSTGVKDSLVHECLTFFNTASKEELMALKGIGEARSDKILEWREEVHEPFRSLDDLKEIGLSSKQINGMMRGLAGGLF